MLEKYVTIDGDIRQLDQRVVKDIRDEFERIDGIRLVNQAKVLSAMREEGLAENHFAGTTGYGYGMPGGNNRPDFCKGFRERRRPGKGTTGFRHPCSYHQFKGCPAARGYGSVCHRKTLRYTGGGPWHQGRCSGKPQGVWR